VSTAFKLWNSDVNHIFGTHMLSMLALWCSAAIGDGLTQSTSPQASLLHSLTHKRGIYLPLASLPCFVLLWAAVCQAELHSPLDWSPPAAKLKGLHP
jgi:hypothetical protein